DRQADGELVHAIEHNMGPTRAAHHLPVPRVCHGRRPPVRVKKQPMDKPPRLIPRISVERVRPKRKPTTLSPSSSETNDIRLPHAPSTTPRILLCLSPLSSRRGISGAISVSTLNTADDSDGWAALTLIAIPPFSPAIRNRAQTGMTNKYQVA